MSKSLNNAQAAWERFNSMTSAEEASSPSAVDQTRQRNSDNARMAAFAAGLALTGIHHNREEVDGFRTFGEVLVLARFMHEKTCEERAGTAVDAADMWRELSITDRFLYLNLAESIISNMHLATTVRYYDK
jgi:hypothetical protein